MTDPGRDLREALEQHQANDDRAIRKQEERERQRRAFEHEEDDIRQHLYEVADLTVAAMAETDPEKILIMPKRSGLGGLFDSDQHVLGWRVAWGYGKPILCADGTLIRPGRHTDYGRRLEPKYSTVRTWIDDELRGIRVEEGESRRDYFRQAFEDGPAHFEHIREESRQRLHSRLSGLKASITRRFAQELHDRGITL